MTYSISAQASQAGNESSMSVIDSGELQTEVNGWVGIGKFGKSGRLLLATALTGAALAVSAGRSDLVAQILPQQSSMPSGSPLGQQQNQSTGNYPNQDGSEQQSYPDPVSGQRLEPTEVREASRNSVNQNREGGAFAQEPNPRLKPPPAPNEFEKFVARATGRELRRFGGDLLLPSNRDYAVPTVATVPPGYTLNPGDTVQISMTGAIEGSVERTIDTDGRIFLPRVGSIQIAGVRFGDLRDRIAAAIGGKFRNFTVNVSVQQLRGVRVYVTGFANNPGAYTVNSLSTLVNAVLAAGGPSAGGSLRSVKLYRNNQQIADFDLYQMLLSGNRAGDALLQNEDVLFIPPTGEQVAVTGSVNTEAVFELRRGETLEDVLRFAGGPNTLADSSRLLVYRQANFDTIGAQELAREVAAVTQAAGGDIVQIVSTGDLQRPLERQSVMVRLEGEVSKPGNYYVRAGTRLSEVLERAGGLTSNAFVYGTRFERASVRAQQRAAFREAIDQFDLTLTAAPLSADQLSPQGERDQQLNGARATLERLRRLEPDGRVVLDIPTSATTLDGSLVLQNNDRIVIPTRPTTVGVFGAVYRPASFELAGKPMRVRDYVERAGGVLRAGNRSDIFVVRASGDVVSRRRGAMKAFVLPGDVVFVPIKTQSNSLWPKIRDIASIIAQFGLTAAAIAAIN